MRHRAAPAFASTECDDLQDLIPCTVFSSCDEDRMKRRDFMTLVGGAVVSLPLAALAQKVGRTYRLGCLSPHARDGTSFNALLFDKLRRAGFIEGQNLAIDYRAFATHLDLISQYVAELVIAQPDVIYAAGGAAI